MRAMILAAGFGTRLWPLTADRTKPALPVMGRPLVGYVAEYLGRNGFTDVVVNLHHRPQSVRDSLGDGSRFGVHLEYVEEATILGTSGAMDNARHLLEGETFAVVNGKIITDIDLQAALETHRRTGAIATLVLRPNPQRERFSLVHTREGFLAGFGGMPELVESDNDGGLVQAENFDALEVTTLEGSRLKGSLQALTVDAAHPSTVSASQPSIVQAAPPLMFTGIQILEPRIFDYIPRGVFSHSTTDVYPQAMAHGERIAAHVAEGMWYELSTIQRYLEINLKLLSEQGRDVVQGLNCEISRAAAVSDSVLWDNVKIEAGAQVHRVVLGDGVRIGGNEIIKNAAVVRADLIDGFEPPEKALKGVRRGANFVVPLAE
jgi:NDP-sugar pyrophosphorylase family protein